MQTDAREVFDLSRESDATLELYGMKRGQTDGFGWPCLVARRLVERGVRFVELVDGTSSHNWDQHGDMAEHAKHAKNIDQPIAGLLKDLRQRGMLDDTLVVWTTEFGRTPGADGEKGRGHHRPVSHRGLPAAEPRAASPTEAPTNWERPSLRTRSTCTTSIQRSCICSAWTTNA